MSIVKRLGGSRAAKIGKDSGNGHICVCFLRKNFTCACFLPAFHPFSIRLFPPMKQGRRSVPLSALQSKVRKAVPEHRQSDSCRSMPELRRMSKQHGIPLCKTSCRILLCHIPPLIRIFPFRAGSVMANGDTSRFAPASIYSGRSQGGKSPLSVCPADRCSLPARAVAPLISSFPSAFISGRPSVQL